MKIYLSYWSAANRKIRDENPVTDSEDIRKKLILTNYSVGYAKKHYKEVHLITDSLGAKIFKDIGFTSIDTSLEEIPKKYKETWSLGKIYAYRNISKKGDPFLHIDYDVFLQKPINPDFLKTKAVIFQSIELNLDTFGYNVDYFYKKCPVRNYAQDLKINYAYNFGVFGGNDLEFINNYASSSIDMVTNKDNASFWIESQYKFNPEFKDFSKAVLAEQYYGALCAKYYNMDIGFIVCSDGKSRFTKGTYWPFDPYVRDHIGYLHIFGSFKDKWFKDYFAGLIKYDV